MKQVETGHAVLQFGSENQSNVHNYLSILFGDFPLIAQSRKVTLIGCARTPRI